MPEMLSLKPVIARIADGARLSADEAQAAFDIVMSGAATNAQIAGLVMGLRVRGETMSELVGAARAMRARMTVVPGVADAMDVCGTGGDGHGTLNISTAVAFVLAALGVPVAKHGNRAVSSRAGAFDTLEALGIPLLQEPAALEAALQMNGLAFIAAPVHHPAMRHAASARSELGTRTIFNLLGPMCNPARVRRQMIGVFAPGWMEPIARAMHLLGSDCVWVVHGDGAPGNKAPGMDELSLAGPNRVVVMDQGRLSRFTLLPEDLGLERHPIEAITGRDAVHNARALERLLGGEPGPYRDTVMLNAAAALQVSTRGNISAAPVSATQVHGTDGMPDRVDEIEAPIEQLRQGLRHAARVLDDGTALSVLNALRTPEPRLNRTSTEFE